MKRLLSEPRPDWKQKIEEQGLVFSTTTMPDGRKIDYWNESAYYEFTEDEVESLEFQAEDMHKMCLEAARFMATGAMGNIGIGPQALELAAESLQAGDMDVYGRFDFIYDGQGGPAKMLEYNADTPTGLIEAAVAQWFWLQDVFPEKDQWNGIHEALIRQWKKMQYRTGMSTLHIAHSEAEESGEDWMTAAYMRDVASQAGWTTIGINMSDIGWDPNLNRFVDLDNFMISTMFKLYPWELMMKEPFGHRLLQRAHNPRWVEPAWKMLLSNKALLAALWHLYPYHPNLLPAYLNEPGPLKEWVAKPLHGREGDNIKIHAAGISMEQPGGYGREGWCYQQFQPLPDFDGNHPVLGLWVVDGESVGCGIRESDGPITDYFCRFVPNTIDAPAPLSAAAHSNKAGIAFEPPDASKPGDRMSAETTTAGGGSGGGAGAAVPAKGLRAGILDLGDSVMLGLASTAPVYSLAATLGLIVAVNGNYTPLILVLGFIPVLFIAYAFRELNSAMPDCGTTFAWSRRAFGPWAGWLGGWGVALAGIVVLANLAQVAGQYLWLLIGDGSLSENKVVVTATGVLFIVFMTLVNYRGIRLGEHVQRVLTYVQYVSLGIFALAIIVRIAGGAPEGQAFDIEWFNPAGAFADPGAVVHGSLLALFIYWGWDTCLAVNEETENPTTTPGRGAVISAFVLVAIYVSVALLVMMYATVGTEGIGLGNEANQSDVFLAMKDVVLGPWGWLIVVAVLASVLSSTQTTILPTARGTLSMGVHGALPPKFGEVHTRNQTPGFSTQVMGVAAVIYYVAMSFLSENLLSDSISAISLFIAFYYALTGFACFWYFRSTFSESARNLWFRGILPLLGALILTAAFFISAVQMWDPAYGDTQIFGVGGAFVSGVVLLALGVVLAIVCRFLPSTREYFTGRPDAAQTSARSPK